jgi:tetratricopeptide (TPR) repeat protein
MSANFDDFDQFLTLIRKNLDNRPWLIKYEFEILDKFFEEGLEPHRIEQVTNILTELTPHFLRRPSQLGWQSLLKELNHNIMIARDRDNFSRNQLMLGKFNLLTSRTKTWKALEQLWIAGETTEDTAERIKAYTELLRANAAILPKTERLNRQQLVEDLLSYAKEADDYTQRVIYYAVSIHFFRMVDLEQAYFFARKTSELAEKRLADGQLSGTTLLDTKTHLIEALIVQGAIHRKDEDIDAALSCFARAEFVLELPFHYYQNALIEYELSWIAKLQENYDLAIEQLVRARECAQEISFPRFSAVIDHTLGILQCWTAEYEQARANLHLALRYWSNIEEWGNAADARHAYGFTYLVEAENALKAGLPPPDLGFLAEKAERHMLRAVTLFENKREEIPEGHRRHLKESWKGDMERVQQLFEAVG